MSLRVLDDERPGFALLVFGGRLEQPSLSLSIRSLRENAFLGPGGKWQRSAHFFTAERVGESSKGTEYRVGPEIVNHLLEHDQIVVANNEGTLREETLWENAVPQMPGTATTHSIYRPPVKVVATEAKPTTRIVAPAAVEPAPAPAAPPPEPEPPPAQPQAFTKIEPAPPPPDFTPPTPSPVPPPKPTWQKYLPLAAIPVVLIVVFAVPQLRCSLFGLSCPAPVPATEDALTGAMACAAEREVSTPCDVRSCFAGYLAKTAPKDVAPKATAVMDSADQTCRNQRAADEAAQKDAAQRARLAEESQALQKARVCAANATDCGVKSCFDGYNARYGNSGAYRSDARAEISAAEARCEISRNASRAMPDGIYTAASLRGCGITAETGIRLTVSGSTVSWQHEFRGSRYSWTGSVDADGNIRASAGPSLLASGRYSNVERDVQMQYPQCGSEAITLTIIGRL